MVNIPLPPEIEAELNLPPEPSSTPDPYLETLLVALESTRGIEIECGTSLEAVALRFKYYAARTRQRKRGVKSLDTLLLQVKGNSLFILPPTKIIQVKEL